MTTSSFVVQCFTTVKHDIYKVVNTFF